MADKGKIKAHIEHLIEVNKDKSYSETFLPPLYAVLGFVNNMQEELVCDNLEEEIKQEHEKLFGNNETIHMTSLGFVEVARHFANWQREQMMKSALDGRVVKKRRTNDGKGE